MIFSKKLLVVFIFLIFLLPSIYSAKLSDFDIAIDIRGSQKAFITENWTVEYDSFVADDKEKFKEAILSANVNLEKFIDIDTRLRPNVFLKNYSDVSIIFDDSKNIITINYEISDLVLENFYETEDDILWKFNENLLRNFIVNNLYVIPSSSKISITAYDPLIITDSNPKGDVERNKIVWNSLSSNEIKLLFYEKKPPKPSFVIITSQESNIFYYLVLLFIILLSIILIFRNPLEKAIKKFVIKNSVIKPKKQKREFLIDQDFFED